MSKPHLLHHGRILCGIPIKEGQTLLRWVPFFEHVKKVRIQAHSSYCRECYQEAKKIERGQRDG